VYASVYSNRTRKAFAASRFPIVRQLWSFRMAGTQPLLAITMAVFLANFPGSAKPDALGIVAQADHASLGSQAASEGTSIFDGDKLSTGAGGSMRLLVGEALLYLAEQSTMIVHDEARRPAKEFEAELISGTVVLSATARSTGAIVASAARVRSVAETRGVVQVRLVAPHELIVFARRGVAEICYRGECETIPDGKSYRVLLNSSDDAAPGVPGTKGSGKTGKALVLVAVGVTAAGIIAARWGHGHRGMESPDHP
jgi:hypothetical protein